MIKRLFGKRDSHDLPKELTIEDLIVLERWDEAIAQLQIRLHSNPNDLHANLRLAEVLVQAGKPQSALDRFLFVAEAYTDDGFYDKAIALLSKIGRLAPGESAIETQMRKAQQLKMLEHRRSLALEGLLAAQEGRDPLARLSLLDAQKLWQGISPTDFVLRLSGEQLKRVFGSSVLLHLDPGRVVAERGSREECLFIVATGELEALVDLGDGRPVLLREFGIGDVVGDRALLEHQEWPATYRAEQPSLVFRLDANGLAKALEGNPDPRLLLDALRSRRHDHDVAATVRKLVGSSA
ncbi:MAG TPA: tetratricopeptide repeat protein [Thermoanaerobaculia bacterium]|nr:tetratricopeptide repeat protein [Thermoanaerobaculia bacterium]